MNGKGFMKQHYLKKRILQQTKYGWHQRCRLYAWWKSLYRHWNNLGEYHDLYLKSDTLLIADNFEIFRKMSLTIYELDAVKFF